MSGASITLHVEGLRELEQSLLELGNAIPGILAAGLKEPMQKVLDDAKALVPRDTGALYDSLALTAVKRATARRASEADTLSEVGLRIRKVKVLQRAKYTRKGQSNVIPNPRSYWHLVEFGTSHSAAHPYIRPAFDANTDHLVNGFKSVAAERIEKTRARFARARGKR